MQERRRHRSGTPGEAARLYLQAALDRHDLAALTLANEDGLLIAAATRGALDVGPLDADWIAAVGCVCALRGRRGPSLGSLVERATGGRELHSAELMLRGERLYVTAVGGALPPAAETAAAVERILGRSLPAAA
jgi:hypothetical protein